MTAKNDKTCEVTRGREPEARKEALQVPTLEVYGTVHSVTQNIGPRGGNDPGNGKIKSAL